MSAVVGCLTASGAVASQTSPIAAKLVSGPPVQPPSGWTLKAHGIVTGQMARDAPVVFASVGVRAKFDAVVSFALANPKYLGSVVFYVVSSPGEAQKMVATLRKTEVGRGVTLTPIGRAVGLPEATDAWGMGTTPIPMAVTAIGPAVIFANPGSYLPDTPKQRRAAPPACETLLRYGVAQAHHSGIPS